MKTHKDLLCKNCFKPFSWHNGASLSRVPDCFYGCPIDNSFTKFYSGVSFVPMANLEYLEMMYERSKLAL
jgi:hypothetical protein